MKSIRVAINGFGRIGRTLFRQILDRADIEVVAINDLGNNAPNLQYMLKYDSILGTLDRPVTLADHPSVDKDWTTSELTVDGRPLKVFSEAKIEAVPWDALEVDIIIDATGNGQNLLNARKALGPYVQSVIFTNAPGVGVDFTFVFDVNEDEYDPVRHEIVAASICDVVGMAPIVRRIDEEFGIAHGYVLTLHPWLGYQNLLDGKPSATEFKDKPEIYRPDTYQVMGRASVGALIPKNTSAVSAMEQVLPGIRGKLSAMSYRVPTEVVTTGSVTVRLNRDTRTEEVREFIRGSVRPPYSSYTEEALISVDYKQNDCSCVVDGKWIEVLDGRMLRFVTWYDNEWGYSARVVDLAQRIVQQRRAGRPS